MAANSITPRDVFERWLEQQPDTARVVLACDTDRLLAESKVLDRPEVTDPLGRKWRLAVFRGDDLRFRFGFRKAAAAGRVAIVLLGAADPEQRIDVSTVGDILAKHEGHDVLDLSLANYLGRFCPQINFPPGPLRHYKTALLARTAELGGAAKKITARWGKPDDWGRAQVAALTLLATAPHLALDDVWPDGESPASFVAQVLRLLLTRPELAGQRAVIKDLATTAAPPKVAGQLFWLKPAADELAAYLVLRAFAGQQKLQNPTAQLAGVGLLPADHDWSEFETLAPAVLRQLETAGDWAAVEATAAPYLTPKRVDKLLTLAGNEAEDPQGLADLLASTPIAPVRHAGLRQLLTLLAKKTKERETILDQWAKEKVCGEAPLTDTDEMRRRVQAGLNVLWLWHRIEGVLAQVLPVAKQPKELLSQYVECGDYRMESDLAQMVHLAHEFGDDAVVEAIHGLAFGPEANDLNPATGSLKDRVRTRLQVLDGKLADLVRPDPAEFAKGVWSSACFLNARLRKRVDELTLGNGEGRVWVLVFDGMRYDTWQLVARPVLAEYFEVVEDQPLFCVPPSFTTVARTSLLAGGPPSEWKGFQGQPTEQEPALAAINFGLSAAEAKTKFRFMTDAETLQARAKLSAAKGEARLVNVLIYGIADDCHDFHGDLAAFHQKILTDLTGNKSQGVAGIVDDLLRRIQPEDEVVVVSDHGFTELLGGDGAEVTMAEVEAANRAAKDDVRWRYAVGFQPKSMPEAVAMEVRGENLFLAVGRRWLRREGTNSPDRYSHGGVSLAEMVVPAVTLKRVTTKMARLSLDGLPESIEMGEDQALELRLQLRNTGTVAVKYAVEARSNLGEELLKAEGSLAAGDGKKLTVTLKGQYREKPVTREVDTAVTLRAVSFRLRHTTLDGDWHEPPGSQITVPVSIEPKPTKLDTEALAGLDNL